MLYGGEEIIVDCTVYVYISKSIIVFSYVDLLYIY